MALLPLCTLFIIAKYFISITYAGTLHFRFPDEMIMRTEGAAHIFRDYENEPFIILTSSEKNATKGRSWSFGCATYHKSIPLWGNSSSSPTPALANFTTHFQFFMLTPKNSSTTGYGEGLAFFLAPSDFEPPAKARGQWLGLFNATTEGKPSNQIVAVEFDTYWNSFDPNGNHVGIDVNSIVSKTNFSVTAGFRRNLNNRGLWDAWVEYDGGAKRLQVFLAYDPRGGIKPETPILSYDIDLSKFLPQEVQVGFSASTGGLAEVHGIYYWDFYSEYSWRIPSGSPSPSPTNAISTPERSHTTTILITVFVCFPLVVVSTFLAWRRRKRGGQALHLNDMELDERFSQGPRKFRYSELRAATKNFSDHEKLGQGGFGAVYKGILPGTGEVVAVKRVSQGSKQGRKEYVSEVSVISKLRHRNLVQLLGWCHQETKFVLVYEFLPNGSLDKYIFGKLKGNLYWKQRYSIVCDIASALVYLHEEWDRQIVHRDVKASNVMLDSHFNAKLGDFGLARVVEHDHAVSDTTVVAGTFGYLAPECVITRKASPQADVFSFGAVTLEIACGRRVVDDSLSEHNFRLVEWVWDLYGQGKFLDAADERLGGNFNAEEMQRVMVVGLLCSHLNPKARPSMRQVLNILKLKTWVPNVLSDLRVSICDDAIPSARSSSHQSSNSFLSSPAWDSSNFDELSFGTSCSMELFKF